jgi:hypothetical protein
MFFGRCFLISFLIGLFFFLQLANELSDIYKIHEKTNFYFRDSKTFIKEFTMGMESGTLDSSIKNPWAAKTAKEFWVHPDFDDEMGVSVDVTRSKALFAEMFPGYSSPERAFWEPFFSYHFNYDLVVPSLNMNTAFARLMKMPWSGCFDFFRAQAADIIIFGTSETSLSVIPALLGRKADSKVLMCARAGFLTQSIPATVEILRGTGYRAKIVLWGYSFWNAYLRSAGLANFASDQADDFELWGKKNPTASFHFDTASEKSKKTSIETAPSFFNYKLSQFFDLTGWAKVYGHSISELYQLHEDGRQLRLKGFFQNPDQEGIHFAQGRSGDLPAMASQARPWYQFLVGVTEKDCDLHGAEQELKKAITSIQSMSDDLYIFLTPVTPLQMNAAPACFREAVKKMLLAAQSPHVHIKTEDWDSYDLAWGDFVVDEGPEFRQRLDINHVNFSGAKKITGALKDWINP